MLTSDLYDERELFKRIAKGDEDAFAVIFHEYNSKLFPMVVKLLKSESEAEEVIQNVFLKLWLNRDKLEEIENPGAWLNRVTSNTALSVLRKVAVAERHGTIIKMNSQDDDEEIEKQLDAKELNSLVHEAMEKLPPGRKEVFRLSRMEGLSREEIAMKLGLSEHTVKNQLASALKFIQQYIHKRQGVYIPFLIFLPFFEKFFRM